MTQVYLSVTKGTPGKSFRFLQWPDYFPPPRVGEHIWASEGHLVFTKVNYMMYSDPYIEAELEEVDE